MGSDFHGGYQIYLIHMKINDMDCEGHSHFRQNISLMFVAFQPECLFHSYPEIGDAKIRCALWTFEQQLALKMRARCDLLDTTIHVVIL